MSVAVIDAAGDFATEIKQSDLQAKGKNGEITIASMVLRKDYGLDIHFLLDISLSQEQKLPVQKEIVRKMIDTILDAKRDRVAIGALGGTVSMLQDLTSDLESAKKVLPNIKVEIPAGYLGGGVATGSGPLPTNSLHGSTSLWTGIYTTVNGFGNTKSTERRKVLVLLSDGVDTSSVSKLKDAVNAAISSNVFVIAIGVGDQYYGGIDRDAMRKFADRSGGVSFFPKNDLKDLTDQIARAGKVLRNFYEISLSDIISKGDSRLVEAKIEIRNPAIKVSKLEMIAPMSIRIQ